MVAAKSYWVVSPNVRANERTAGEWRNCSVLHGAAFMGWSPDERGHGGIGPRFAGKINAGIAPGDVILIARRHQRVPEIVGFGQVVGEAKTEAEYETPEPFGSLRHMRPFISWSHPPAQIPFSAAVRHTMALAKLHPEWNAAHREICDWMDGLLDARLEQRPPTLPPTTRSDVVGSEPISRTVKIVSSSNNKQLDYLVRTKVEVRRAEKREAELLEAYRQWLKVRGRNLQAARYGRLQCDGFELLEGESSSGNLIEAKCSPGREYIRMAVGQLLDYEFQGRGKFISPYKAILVPQRPDDDLIEWLDSMKIKIIWQSGHVFIDNDNGRFT